MYTPASSSMYDLDNWPFSIIFIGPSLIDNLFILISTSALPIAIIILPQLGSLPAIAVLTKGELAIEKAIFFASFSVFALITLIVINLLAPSPSSTILFDKFNNTECKALSKSAIFLSLMLFIIRFFNLPVEKIETISLVLVSPSQLIALNVVSIFFFSNLLKISFERLASVKIYPSVVAIFGKIIPEPFAIPYIFTFLLPISHSSIASFGFVSVVIIPIAALIQISLFCVYFILSIKFGILLFIFSVGYFSPIVPVHPKSISLAWIFFGLSSSSICFFESCSETSSAISLSPLYPRGPVKALAFLVFIIRAFIFLLLRLKFHLIFSETILDFV